MPILLLRSDPFGWQPSYNKITARFACAVRLPLDHKLEPRILGQIGRDEVVRLQSSHHHADRGLDAYFSPPEAVASLLHIERGYIPEYIWEPAAGDGAIVRPLLQAGFRVVASDIADYGLDGCKSDVDYLKAEPIQGVEGIITNPPFRLAVQFAEKALEEVYYVALLLRTNFLESTERLTFFRKHQPARIWISSRRLPMMHRHGWQGRRAPSNTCFAWFVWDKRAEQKRVIDWFDWKSITSEKIEDLYGSAKETMRAVA